MSELVQIKKLLTFEEICPMWFTALTGGPKSEILDWVSFKYCIVGEAHGFDRSYMTDSSKTCLECFQFSGGLPFTGMTILNLLMRYDWSREELENHPVVKDFVRHFNECHVTLTGPDCL